MGTRYQAMKKERRHNGKPAEIALENFCSMLRSSSVVLQLDLGTRT